MRRIMLVFVLTVSIFIGCVPIASANYEADVQPYSSERLSSAIVTAIKGSDNGEIDFKYLVVANSTMATLGISKIAIYTSAGVCVASISGTTSNGLLTTSASPHSGTYTYNGASGTS
ncbi:MAG: hypothetical protein LUG92_05240 [Oscillospiraceae bacterium]|nr:hypothetical protein [Oscillospiraceae bacterium]